MVAQGVWPSSATLGRFGEPAQNRGFIGSGGYRQIQVVQEENEPRKRGAERPPMGLRPMMMRLGTVSEAAGSCYMECGKSKVLCSVYGPRPDPRAAHFSNTGRLECTVKLAPFCGAHVNEIEETEKQMPLLLRPALEAALQVTKFPKSVLDVCILVIESDGDATSSAITCSSMALADAGIEMYDLVAACTVVKLPDGSFIVDPEGDEDKKEKGCCQGAALTAVMPSRGEVTLMNHHGEWEVAELQRAVVAGVEAARQTQTVMRSALLESHAQKGA